MRCTTINARRFRILLALIAAAALAAGLSALVGSKSAEAAFPGNNGLIAFASNRSIASGDPSSSDSEIFTAPLIGDLTQLTKNSTDDGDPTFSADGTKIAFTSRRPDGNDEVYVMNADGSGQTNLTNNAAHDSEPAFSPDGKQIVFATNRGFGGTYAIYKMNADGTGATHLTENQSFDYSPAWSPEGNLIIFQSNVSGNTDLWAMNADGSNQFNLTGHPATDDEPDWQPT